MLQGTLEGPIERRRRSINQNGRSGKHSSDDNKAAPMTTTSMIMRVVFARTVRIVAKFSTRVRAESGAVWD